jgi:hypothetical protein
VCQTYVLYIVPDVGTLVVAFPGEESDTAKNASAVGIYLTVKVAWAVDEALSWGN